MRSQIADAPVNDPDDDLLGTAPYARTLADFIYTLEPPFTIGIYGEWGSGKTSFVSFVRSYLDRGAPQGLPSVRFVSFSAWPYRTSDELWRALILEIARTLLLKHPSAGAAHGHPHPSAGAAGLSPRRSGLREFLSRDALVLRAAPPETGPRAEYERLVSRLDAMHGGVAKGPQAQVDPEQLGLTLANAAVAALAAMSPLAAAARRMFGMPSGVDTAKLIPRERNEATRDRIQSMEEFRSAFQELFDGALQPGERVVVFIDDLDRCMPDDALDVLEAVKNFLGEVRCVFIVAADEELIGQGLRLRYRDLMAAAGGGAAAPAFAQKGQEYFEKIIQLAIRVPQRTADQTDNFIAAQFPEWLPATDIIQAAIGNNPRRVKQYCSWLQYRWMVSLTLEEQEREVGPEQAQESERARVRSAVLEKVITLSRWSTESLALVAELASAPQGFAAAMERVESALEYTTGDRPDPEIARSLAAGPVRTLYEAAAESAPLARLFRSHPRFTSLPPIEVSAAACLSDARPHPTELLTSRDMPFVRVFSQVTSGVEVSAEKLVQEAFAWLLELAAQAPLAVQLAVKAAEAAGPGAAWTEQMVEVERQLALGGSGGPTSTDLSSPALELLAWARTPPLPGEPPEGRRQHLLAGSLRLSMLLREEVMAFHAAVPGPDPSDDAKSPAHARVKARAARASSPLLASLDDPKPGLEFRVWAARHFIQLRKFAKLDAFFRRWPELAQRLVIDRTSITTLEAQLVSPQELAEPMQRLWDEHRGDKALLQLLALRPLFLHIEDAELDRYLLVSRALGAEDRAPPPIPAVAAVVAQAALADEPALLDVVLEVEALAHDPGHEPTGERFRVSLRAPTPELSGAEGEVVLSWTEVEQRLREFPRMMRDVPVMRAQVREGGTTSDIEDMGRYVFERLLPGNVQAALLAVLRQGQGLRLIWKAERGSRVMSLPLEAMWVVPARMYPALSPIHSVVRYLEPGLSAAVRPIGRPLRILAVFSNPVESARLEVRAEADVMRRVLKPAMQDGRVLLEVLVEREATLPRLQEMVRTFMPHVFHYVGHGTYQPDSDQGALVLHDHDGGPRVVPDVDVITLLQDKGIQLVLLNGCETGRTSPQNAVSGIAGLLVHRGIPAVIAALRPVLDDPAILFTREFYRTFVDGHPLEESLVEARKALSVERWDWTAYALFTGTPDLRSIRLPPAGTRRSQPASA